MNLTHAWSLSGGGFGGLAAAQALREAEVDITLIDRTNHHLFQPLLYQVATAALSPRYYRSRCGPFSGRSGTFAS